MFGSTNPFGQASSSPFGTQSIFGQTNNATNPFAPKQFGSTSPFGSQTGSSVFGGGTSTGVFGTPQSSTPAFGASPTPAFGSSIPAFGASSTPSFGSTSSSFGGSSLFGQKPAFGGFGSSPSQTSPFISGFQQTQPFGNNLFGSSTPFGAPSQPAFGATNTPAFGATSTPTFGSTATPAFGSTGTAFGASSAPAFGSSSTPTFGASSTPAFGASSTPAFGAPAFGSSSTPAFGASSTPAFSFGSTPAFGQTTSSTFGSTPFGSTPSPFGAQSSPFGAKTSTSAFGSAGFGQSAFGGQRGGSRVAPYTPTAEVDGGTGTQPAGKLESISSMPVYKDKSHEELRWVDYQVGDKGGPNPSSQVPGGISFPTPTQSSPFSTTSTFGQPTQNLFSSTVSSNPFGQKTPGFGSSSTSAFSSPFAASSSSPFGTTTSASGPSIFGASTSGFGASSSSIFSAPSTSSFGSSPSVFGSSALGTASTFGSGLTFGNSQSSGLFQSSTSSIGQTTSVFGQTTPGFGQTANFGQTNPFGTASSGFGANLFPSNSTSLPSASNPIGFGQTTISLSNAFQPATSAQTLGAYSFTNLGQTQPAASSGFSGISNAMGQGAFGQSAASQSNMTMQPAPVTNPFGTLPTMPQISIGRANSAPSVQYGISAIPVADKPPPVRISSLLTSRHLSQRRIRLLARKYHPKNDGPKVPFFSDDEEVPSTPKADAFFIPRENPRALVIRPMEQWPPRTNAEKQLLLKDMASPVHGNGKISEGGSAPVLNGFTDRDKNVAEDGFDKCRNAFPVKPIQKKNGIHEDHGQKGDSYFTISGHRAGEAAIVYEHGADIEALMPKLRHSDYYTEPQIQELAAKERAEPGYCLHVKDFVVGHHGYGSIKFSGETDVRRLDLEYLIQFSNKEVIVYVDDSKKPPAGQGLNKPAEVTLLNIKYFNKKNGEQYTEGPKVEKYREMLRKKTQDQGAEFVSYDPVKGEWKFKVKHF